MKNKKSFAIKKLFPKFYQFQKNLINKIPIKTSLWDKKSYKVNLRIHKMIKTWKTRSLMEEANIVYENYNGGDMIDVGAFTGFYSFLLSPKSNNSDNFISCEPDRTVHNELYDNLSILKKLFKYNKYSVITNPINNGKEVVIAHDEWGHPCFLDTQKVNKDDLGDKVKIDSKTIDSLVKSMYLQPKFIKIDTEGAEHDVLEGMKETLKNFKPMIMLEKHPTMVPKYASLESIDKLLEDNNYKAMLINKDTITIRELWK